MSGNIPYIYVKGAIIERLYISPNFGAEQLPDHLLNNGITTDRSLLLTMNDYIALGTKGDCEFSIEKYYRFGSFNDNEEYLLLAECDREGKCSIYNF